MATAAGLRDGDRSRVTPRTSRARYQTEYTVEPREVRASDASQPAGTRVTVPVLVPFMDETAPLPIGPDGAPVEVEVDQAVVTVSDPAPATFFALIAEPVVVGLTTLGGILLLCLFCINLARGRAFSSSTVRIVFTAAGVLIVGWVLGSLFRTMGVNGTLAAVSDGSYEAMLLEFDFAPLFGTLALAAVAAAFQIGHRLQRETEGLV